MPRSRSETSKQVLARIQRLCCLGVGSEILMPDLIQQVNDLIPLRGGFFLWMNANREKTNSYGIGPIPTAALYHKEFHLTPRETDVVVPVSELMASASSNAVHQFWPTLRVDYPTFLHSDYYNEVCRPSDIHEVVTMVVREANRNHGALEIYRAAGEPPFQLRDFKLLEAVSAFVAHAMIRGPATEDIFVGSEDRGVLVADLDGTVRHAGWQTQRLLQMALGPRLKTWATANRHNIHGPIHGPLPDIARLCGILADTAKGKAGRPPPVLRLETHSGSSSCGPIGSSRPMAPN